MSRFHTTEFDLLPERAFTPRGGRLGRHMTLEGGKGSDAPTPDPRLATAQIRSMGIQDEAILRTLALAEEMAPIQREQLQFGLTSARTAYEQSQADRDWLIGRRERLGGLQDQMIEEARSFDTEARRAELAGQAVADVTQAFGITREQARRDMQRRGVNPVAGATGLLMARTVTDEALARAGASTGARRAALAEGRGLTATAANALAGYPAMGMTATSAGATFGGAGLGLANTGLAGLTSNYSMAGQMAGQMGQNATGMFNAQANYKLGADRIAAESDPFATLVGVGGQLGAAAIGKYSDRRLKQDIEMVGRDARTGLNLYEFAYIGEPHRRYRGVMADEVESRFPDAVVYDDMGFASVYYDKIGIEMTELQGAQ